ATRKPDVHTARLAGPRLAGPRLAGPRLAGPRLAGPRLAGPRLAGPRLAGQSAGPGMQHQRARRDLRGGAVVARAVLAGAHPGQFGEPGAERARRDEPDRVAHLGHRHVAAAQQRLGPLDPAGHQVVVRRLAERRAEAAREGPW